MRGTRVEESAYRNGMWEKGWGDKKGIGIRKSRCIESDIVSYADNVNAMCSIFLRVVDYFFESAESALDLGAKTLTTRALAACHIRSRTSDFRRISEAFPPIFYLVTT